MVMHPRMQVFVLPAPLTEDHVVVSSHHKASNGKAA